MDAVLMEHIASGSHCEASGDFHAHMILDM